MRLRTTADGTLSFVELDQSNLTTEYCVLDFKVTGNVATLKGVQKCFAGEAYERTFLCDRLEWNNSVVKEVGVIQLSGTQPICSESFEYEYSPHP